MAKKNSNQRKKRVGSYPYTNVVFSITTALFMIGLFCIFAIGANRLTAKLRNDIEVKVFLLNDLTQEMKDQIRDELTAQSYIDLEDGQARVRYLSKDDAAKQMIQDNGEDFISFLGENPLRDAFIINIASHSYSDTSMAQIKQQIEANIDGVFEVYYPKEQVEEININIQRIGFVIAIFVIILLITVVILINNSIKLALFSQRFLIRSMQLVGATPFFIKKPFLIRAVFQGALSGFLASSLLVALIWLAIQQYIYLGTILLYQDAVLVFAGLLIVGSLIGFLSAFTSVTRYLKMKLDDLY
ncbi:MAG: cell division protein FtsX [Flammeovirgaceae bacterium]